jgi:putative copper export protein
MPDRPLIEWSSVLSHLLEFVGAFLALGAIGFRFVVLRRFRRRDRHGAPESAALVEVERRAAAIGLIGVLVGAAHVAEVVQRVAARQHLTAAQLLTQLNPTAVLVAATGLAIIGFVLAMRGSHPGWALAGLGVMAGTLRGALFGQWPQLIKPVHLVAGGLWIGSLFLLVVGLGTILRRAYLRERRGAIAAEMVQAFSPLALVMGGVLATFGATLLLREIERPDQLWSTPYGRTLVLKLLVVALVFGLGAWNWRRQRPKLGTEVAARSLVGTATGELVAAMVVIAITAVLASLPSPKAP